MGGLHMFRDNGIIEKLVFVFILCSQSLTKLLLSFVDYSLVVGTDVNAVVNPSVDKSLSTVYGNQASQSLNDFIVDNDLCDIWRMKNENCRDYTFCSSRRRPLQGGQLWPNGKRVGLITRRLQVRVPGLARFVGGGSE